MKYLNIDEQIELLKTKKLNFKDEKKARIVLQTIGYYKLINAYKIPFMHTVNGKREYLNNVYFEDLYNLYEFDRKLKTIVFELITTIEIHIKAYISDLISSKYGIDDKVYLNPNNFEVDSEDYKFNEMKNHIMQNIEKQIKNNHPSIVWYKNNYGFYPFWVIANVLTLGSMSKIYSKLKNADKIAIAKKYNLPFDYLSSYLIHINLFRNICAHNDVLYRYKSINSLPQKVKNVKQEYEKIGIKLNKITGRYEKGINDFLSIIIIFKLKLSKNDYNLFKTQFNSILTKLSKEVNDDIFEMILNEMGLDNNWKEYIKL